MSTFGRDTIRGFTSDASSLKRLAARDYEDLLLCSMAVFDGLFPDEHNDIVQDLLFALLTWHALAKLRVHTDSTLDLLLSSKRCLGATLKKFADVTCNAYETRELPQERAKRERMELRRRERQLKKQQQQPSEQSSTGILNAQDQPNVVAAKGPQASRRARFNLNTYKAHAPEHYMHDIRLYGSLDSFSTQIVCGILLFF